MQAALAIVLATQGRAAESAAWLATLHAEGVDLAGLDASSPTLRNPRPFGTVDDQNTGEAVYQTRLV